LLEHAGQLVTRDELKQRLWPSDTFGDFDHGLNKAVNRLREVLGDSAENPRFVETVPRRGYRFIAPTKERDDLRGGRGADESGEPRRAAAGRFRKFLVPGVVLGTALGGVLASFIRPLPPPRVLGTTQLTHDGLTKTGGLTDGSRLYITESTGSKQFLVETSATGGESTIIPTPFDNIVISDISPDHSQMLVADAVGPGYEFPVWVLPLPGGSPRRLGEVVARCDAWSSQGWATWSLDGRQLAYAKGSDIYLANADGNNSKKLITLSGYASEIRFSPDSTHLRFTLRSLQNNRSASIWDVRSDGSGLHALLPGWRSPSSHMAGDWSRDGRYYFFTSCEGPNGCTIWAIREPQGLFRRQASAPIQLTTGPISVYFNGISADGSRIFAGGWTARSEVVRYDAGSHQFVPFLGSISAAELNFSRNGEWVAYVSHPDSTLWRGRVEGSERLQLTSAPISALMPRWSPDGTQIAFVDEQAGPLWKIFLISAQGGAPQEILSENQYQMDPSWSPDGKQIAFGRVPWLKESDEKIAIQIFTINSKKVSIIPGSQNLFAPRWSPDGKYVAALSVDGKKLFLYEFSAQKWSEWVNESGDIEHPEWSRDGKYI